MFKKKFLILRILLATLIGIILLGYVLLQLPSVQNYLGHVVANRISKAIGTEVKVGRVGFSLFDKLDVEDLLIKDQKNDTLIYAKSFKLRISDLFFSSNDPTIKYIGLDNAKVYVNRETETWNYQFILDYLNKDSNKNNSKKNFDLKKIDLNNIHFIQNDKWLGKKSDLTAENVLINIKSNQADQIAIDLITINKPFFTVQNIKALNTNKTPTNKKSSKQPNIFVSDLKILNGKIWIEDGNNIPIQNFDGMHIRMQDLNASIKNISKINELSWYPETLI